MTSLIKLDYDMPRDEAIRLFFERKKHIFDIVGLKEKNTRSHWEVSKSGNTHIHWKFEEDLEPLEILAVQLIMGSDPVREAFNLRRIRRGQKNWNILFLPGDSEYR